MELKQIEKISKALGDVNRLKILHYMHNHKGQMECMEIGNILNLAQPSISHHIKKLIESGLIEPHKEGRYYSYKINTTLWEEFQEAIKSFTKA
ncbi:MAG TPA: metalloregulator ArsR/SmtB family transcription factor [Cytophagales bacterium]|nr:metalloregulator ArsR/SmtB family transcription factor [Cytophagales bacterium]